jgi:hypothetical protein
MTLSKQSEEALNSTTEDYTWIDDAFRVRESRFGLFISVKKDGEEVITAMTEEECVKVTRFHLKGEQEGFPEPLSVQSGPRVIDL